MEVYYQNDDVKLYQGDCLKIMDKLIEQGVKVDAVIADIPYGTTQCKWDEIIPFDKMWDKIHQLSSPQTPIVLFGSEPFSSKLRMSNIKNYKYDWKWDKVVGSNFVHAKRMPLKIYEDIMVFYKKQPVYNPQMTERKKENERKTGKSKLQKNRINGINHIITDTKGKKKYPVNKIKINRLTGELNSKHIVHPAQKPLDLMEYLINTYTNEGDLILDFTCGSGTTLVAAQNLGRKSIGIELEEEYCRITKERLLESGSA